MNPDANLIGLYADAGATLHFLREALKPLQDEGLHVAPIGRADIVERNALDPRTTKYAALILPGTGRGSSEFRSHLQGQGNTAVRNFCHAGATVVGICAGMGSMVYAVDWRHPQLTKYSTDNIAIFNGTTRGPLDLYHPAAPVRDGWFRANTAAVHLPHQTNDARLLWWEGGFFIPDEEVNVLARFRDVLGPDGKPAIAAAHKPYGAGDGVITSIHFEVSGRILAENVGDSDLDMDVNAPRGTYRRGLVAELDKHEDARLRLMMSMFQPLLDKRAASRRRYG